MGSTAESAWGPYEEWPVPGQPGDGKKARRARARPGSKAGPQDLGQYVTKIGDQSFRKLSRRPREAQRARGRAAHPAPSGGSGSSLKPGLQRPMLARM